MAVVDTRNVLPTDVRCTRETGIWDFVWRSARLSERGARVLSGRLGPEGLTCVPMNAARPLPRLRDNWKQHGKMDD